MTSKIVRADGVTELTVKSATFTEKVNGDVDLRPGCVASAMLDVVCYGSQSDAPSAGEELTYYQVVNGVQTLIGLFYAEPSVPSRGTFSFTAYDAVSKLDVDYSAHLQTIQSSFPMTLSALATDVATVAGVTLNNAPALNTYSVNAFYVDGITCRDVMKYIAEFSCQFVRATTAGEIRFDWYATKSGYKVYPTSGSSGGVTYIPYRESGLDYANYNVAALSGVAVHPVGTDDAAYIYPPGASGNLLHIRDNVLLTGAAAATYTAVAMTAYARITGGLTVIDQYRPAKMSLFPNESPLRAGDVVNVEDAQGVTFKTIVMAYTVSESGATAESTGHETLGEGTSTDRQLVQLASDIVQINKLKVGYADIDSIMTQYLTVRDANDNIIFQADANGHIVSICGWKVTSNGFIKEIPGIPEVWSFTTDGMMLGTAGNQYAIHASGSTLADLGIGPTVSLNPTIQDCKVYITNGDVVSVDFGSLKGRLPTAAVANLDNLTSNNDVCLIETDSTTLNTPHKANLTAYQRAAVISYCADANNGTQVSITHASQEIFMRRLYNGTWSDWSRVISAPTAVTVTNGTNGGKSVTANKVGNVVHVSGYFQTGTNNFTTSTAVFTMDDPPAAVTYFPATRNASTTYAMKVLTTGEVVFVSNANFSSSVYVYYNFSYITS